MKCDKIAKQVLEEEKDCKNGPEWICQKKCKFWPAVSLRSPAMSMLQKRRKLYPPSHLPSMFHSRSKRTSPLQARLTATILSAMPTKKLKKSETCEAKTRKLHKIRKHVQKCRKKFEIYTTERNHLIMVEKCSRNKSCIAKRNKKVVKIVIFVRGATNEVTKSFT